MQLEVQPTSVANRISGIVAPPQSGCGCIAIGADHASSSVVVRCTLGWLGLCGPIRGTSRRRRISDAGRATTAGQNTAGIGSVVGRGLRSAMDALGHCILRRRICGHRSVVHVPGGRGGSPIRLVLGVALVFDDYLLEGESRRIMARKRIRILSPLTL